MVGRQVMYDLRHRPGIDRLSAFGAQEIMLFPKLLIGVLCSQYLPNEFANFGVHCEGFHIDYGRDGVPLFWRRLYFLLLASRFAMELLRYGVLGVLILRCANPAKLTKPQFAPAQDLRFLVGRHQGTLAKGTRARAAG